MLGSLHLPSSFPNADVQTFIGEIGNSDCAYVWQKPRGKTMAQIMLWGRGGSGGNGVVGANNTAAGGGGGGSASQTILMVPLWALPEQLFINLGTAAAFNVTITFSQIVNIGVAPAARDVLAWADSGRAGGNGSGAVGGTGGAAGGAAGSTQMPLGWPWRVSVLAGQAGVAGGTTGAGSSVGLPTTGLLVTSGNGGGGLPAAGAVGSNGGGLTGAVGAFPAHNGGAGAATATTPGGDGVSGYQPLTNVFFLYSGSGGGSTHGSATGAGLVGGNGGVGMPGCGGGGGGGALTGSTQGLGGRGGPAMCIITCW